jgi:hypothetical protein
MIAPETARAALEPLWQAMIELAEWSNDQVVDQQIRPSSVLAGQIGQSATDLATLAHVAAILARHSQGGVP